jgi:hypothetical protein
MGRQLVLVATLSMVLLVIDLARGASSDDLELDLTRRMTGMVNKKQVKESIVKEILWNPTNTSTTLNAYRLIEQQVVYNLTSNKIEKMWNLLMKLLKNTSKADDEQMDSWTYEASNDRPTLRRWAKKSRIW